MNKKEGRKKRQRKNNQAETQKSRGETLRIPFYTPKRTRCPRFIYLDRINVSWVHRSHRFECEKIDPPPLTKERGDRSEKPLADSAGPNPGSKDTEWWRMLPAWSLRSRFFVLDDDFLFVDCFRPFLLRSISDSPQAQSERARARSGGETRV